MGVCVWATPLAKGLAALKLVPRAVYARVAAKVNVLGQRVGLSGRAIYDLTKCPKNKSKQAQAAPGAMLTQRQVGMLIPQ